LIRAKDTQQPEQWLVSQHAKLISKGDLVVIWGAGRLGGVYALGQIVTIPAIVPLNNQQLRYFSKLEETVKFKDKPSAYVEYFKVSTDKPLLTQTVCSQDKILVGLQVFMNPQGTNFRLGAEQWDRVLALINN
jgi:hypothetical protein